MSDLRNLKQDSQPLTPTQVKRRKQFAALMRSLAPRKSVGFVMTPTAGDAERDQRFALRRGTI